MLELIQSEYPSVKNTHSTRIHLGLAMKELGFENWKRGNVTFYRLIPVKAA